MQFDELNAHFIHQDAISAGASPPRPEHRPTLMSSPSHISSLAAADLGLSAEALAGIRSTFADVAAHSEVVAAALPSAFATLKMSHRPNMKLSVEKQTRAVEVAIAYAKERDDKTAYAYVPNAQQVSDETPVNEALLVEIEISYEGTLGWVITRMRLVEFEDIEECADKVDYYARSITASFHTSRVVKFSMDNSEPEPEQKEEEPKPTGKVDRGLTRTRYIFD